MTKRTQTLTRVSLAVTFALLTWACESSPTSPSRPAPLAQPTYTLSGNVIAVTGTGATPVEGVRVEATNFFQSAITDRDGLYVISGLLAGSSPVRATKWGYETDTKSVTIVGDTRLDFQVVPRPTYTLSGVVSEMTPMGRVPVEDVEVYCDSCGEFGHTAVHTDPSGFYSFSWVYATDLASGHGLTTLLVKKVGYQESTEEVAIDGDTTFDIQLVRR